MPAIDVIDPFDEHAFDEWYDVMRAAVTHERRAPLVWTRSALAYVHRNPTPRTTRLLVAAREEGDRIDAIASLDLPQDADTEVAEVEIGTRPEGRGHGLGAALWDWVAARAAEEGRVVFQTEIDVPAGRTEDDWPGMRFARARGFTVENSEDHFALAVEPALHRLRSRRLGSRRLRSRRLGSRRHDVDSDDEVVSWVDRCPEDLVAAYARMRTLMNADVPTGGMVRKAREVTVADIRTEEERSARSYRTLVSLARRPSGEPAGYTMIFVPLEDPAQLMQDDTYVMRAHRGHRLGERLKWANLAQVADVAPTAAWIHTWTEQHNHAMQRINRDVGFEPVEVMHEVQLDRTVSQPPTARGAAPPDRTGRAAGPA